MAVGGTFAWKDYKQHKSNELSGSQIKYEARLIEDFEEVHDWKVGEDIKKEIRVGNLGTAAKGYGDVYVRLQLKEFMSIGEMIFVETPVRYMVARGGQSYTCTSGNTYNFADGHFLVFKTQADAMECFAGHNVADLEDKVTGDKGWFVETRRGDINGQYGKYVVIDYGFGTMAAVIPGSEFCPVDQRNHHGAYDAQGNFVTKHSPECDYPEHGWGTVDRTALIDEYIAWVLGADIVRLSVWDGNPVAKWIIDDRDPDGLGWAYWGQALQPGQTTSNILEKVTLIKQPDGNFYYVIHVDMEALSIDEFINGDGLNWDDDVRESYLNNRPSITWNDPPPTTVKAGEYVQSPTVTVGPAGAAQGPLTWSTSNPAIATVDADGKVYGVAPGVVTIIVRGPNGGREQYSLTVTPGDPVVVPVQSVTLDKSAMTLAPGGSGALTATVLPTNATNKALNWSIIGAAGITVTPTGTNTATVAASGSVATGATATVTVTTADGGKIAVCTVTVQSTAPQPIPTLGDEFDMGDGYQNGDYDPDLDYSVDAGSLYAYNFYEAEVVPGSVKLSDIIAPGFGASYTGLTVTAVPATLNPKVSIGDDKDGDKALLITYYGTLEQWQAAPEGHYPAVQMTLVLHAAGYADTTIKVNLTFEGTGWIPV